MFLIFGGSCYYADGGGYDLLASAENKKEAQTLAELFLGKIKVIEIAYWSNDRDDDVKDEIEWTHILDTKTLKVIQSYGDEPHGSNCQAIEIREKGDL